MVFSRTDTLKVMLNGTIVATLFQMVATLFQHYNAICCVKNRRCKSSLVTKLQLSEMEIQIVPLNCKVDEVDNPVPKYGP